MTEHDVAICDYEGSDYQQRFWEQGGRDYEDQVEAVALRRLLPPSGNRLLEIGAGAGRNTPRYRGFRQVALLDYSKTQLEQAQERLGADDRYLYIVADAYHLPFAPGAFDATTIIRVLHHMADPQTVLGQVRATLASEGTFILEYANKRNLKAIGRWLLRRQAWNPFDLQPVEFAPLNFNFHPASIQTWLSQADFTIEKQLTVSHFRLDQLKRIVPLRLLVLMDSIAQWTGVLFQLTPSVFVRARAVGDQEPNPRGAFWRCPACRSLDVVEEERAVQCNGCGAAWPIEHGIYSFRQPDLT